MFNERDPRWPQASKAEDLIPLNFGLPQKRKGVEITQVIEELQAEDNAAVNTQEYTQHRLLNNYRLRIKPKPKPQ
jgi:hypothetical protein